MLKKSLIILLLSISFSCQKNNSGSPGATTPNQPGNAPSNSPSQNPSSAKSEWNWLVAIPKGQKLNPDVSTHFILSGYGADLKTLFQEASIATGRRLEQAFPTEQIVFIFESNEPIKSINEIVNAHQFQVITTSNERLTGPAFESFLGPFRNIKSMHVFSHSNYSYAAMIDDGYYFQVANKFDVLKSKLDQNAYLIFYGCNAGWNLAPYLAHTLQVPVAGSLTSSDFEQLHSSGNFYRNEIAYAPPGPWAPQNGYSFFKPRTCHQGNCLRMKPDNFPYSGIWGSNKNGLPFYKFSCPSNNKEKCAKAMALALISYPDLKPLNLNSSDADFKMTARHWLCPINSKTQVRSECIEKLKDVENGSIEALSYSSFEGQTTYCDEEYCYYDTPVLKENRTFTNEYKMFLKGIAELKGSRSVE